MTQIAQMGKRLSAPALNLCHLRNLWMPPLSFAVFSASSASFAVNTSSSEHTPQAVRII